MGGITIGCLYLPNGSPAPGPKSDCKREWFERLRTHAASLLELSGPVVLVGDYNVFPTERDVDRSERWADNALLLPETREAYRRLLTQGGTDALRHLYVNGGGKVQRPAGEMGDTRYPGYLPGAPESMGRGAVPPADRPRRLASRSR